MGVELNYFVMALVIGEMPAEVNVIAVVDMWPPGFRIAPKPCFFLLGVLGVNLPGSGVLEPEKFGEEGSVRGVNENAVVRVSERGTEKDTKIAGEEGGEGGAGVEG